MSILLNLTLIEQLLIRSIKTQSTIFKNLFMETKPPRTLRWERQWTSTISLNSWMTFDKQVSGWRPITLCLNLTKCKDLSRCLRRISPSTRCLIWTHSSDTDHLNLNTSNLLWILWILVPLLKVFFQTVLLDLTAQKDRAKVFKTTLLSVHLPNLNLNSF